MLSQNSPLGLYPPSASMLEVLLTHCTALCLSFQVTHLYTLLSKLTTSPSRTGSMFSILTSTHCSSAHMSCDVCLGDLASAPRRCLINLNWPKGFIDQFPRWFWSTDKPWGSRLCWPIKWPSFWPFTSSHLPPSLLVQMHTHWCYPPLKPFLSQFLFFFFFLSFLGPHPWHMEVPRLGVEQEL